jgi:hypothetical protein
MVVPGGGIMVEVCHWDVEVDVLVDGGLVVLDPLGEVAGSGNDVGVLAVEVSVLLLVPEQVSSKPVTQDGGGVRTEGSIRVSMVDKSPSDNMCRRCPSPKAPAISESRAGHIVPIYFQYVCGRGL